MADEVVGSAKITIEPDLTGFDAALLSELTSSLDQANAAIVASFKDAAEQANQDLSAIGQAVDLSSVGAAADQTANDIDAVFADAGSSIADSLTTAADTADAALSDIGTSAAADIGDSFADAGSSVSDSMESGSASGSAALEGLGEAGGQVAESLLEQFGELSDVVGLAAVGLSLGGLIEAGESANARLKITNQIIENTGHVAGITSDGIGELATNIRNTTNFSAGLVRQSANVLLLFKNVRNAQGEGENAIFTRTIRDAADLATIMGTDLTGATRTLGRALEDPVRGATLLRRANVILTASQKDQIKAFVAAGDTISAQKVILDELESRVGGVAEAGAQATTIIKNSLISLATAIGVGIAPAFDDLAEGFPDFVDQAKPALEEVGQAIGAIVTDVVKFGTAALPVFAGVAAGVGLVLKVVEPVAGIFEHIPTPILTTAVAVFALTKAAGLLEAVSIAVASSVTGAAAGIDIEGISATVATIATGGFTASLEALEVALGPVTLLLVAIAAPILAYNKLMGDAQKKGHDFAKDVRSTFDPAGKSLKELRDASGDLGDKIGFLNSQIDDSFLGRNGVNKDFNESLKTGVDDLKEFQAEIDKAIQAQEDAAVIARFDPIANQFVGLADALDQVQNVAPGVASAIDDIRIAGDKSDDSFIGLAQALDGAKLSEADLAAAAKVLGTDSASLQGFIDGVTGALKDFVTAAAQGLPTVASAFQDANKDSKVSAREFINGLAEDTTQLLNFVNGLKEIVAAGFGDVAGALAQQGVDTAGNVVTELTKAIDAGNTTLLEKTRDGLNARQFVEQASIDYFSNVLGPQFIEVNGTVAQAATAAFGANFDPAAKARFSMELAATGLDETGQKVASIAATKGNEAAVAYGRSLDLDEKTIAEAIKAGTALRAHAPTDVAHSVGVEIGTNLGQGLASGIANTVYLTTLAMGQTIAAAHDAARMAAKSQSPSRLFMDVGADIGEGLAIGVSDSEAAVIQAAEDIVRSLASSIAASNLTTGIDLTPSLNTPGGGLGDQSRVLAGVGAGVATSDASISSDTGDPTVMVLPPPQLNLVFDGTERFFVEWLRHFVRVEGGGSVQAALGQGDT